MGRKVLCTFSNGGQLIKAKQSQIDFVKNITGRMVERGIDLNILTKTMKEYHDAIQHVIRMKRYNTGKQANMLNELRMCFTPLPKTRRRL